MQLEAETAPEVWEQASALAKRFVTDAVQEIATTFDDCYDSNVEEVESESRDGFIAYTDGGWDGVAYATLSYAHGSGHIPAAVRGAIDSSIADAEADFAEEHGLTVAEMDAWEDEERAKWEMPTLPGMPRASYPPQHPLREQLWELIDSWLGEGGTYFYKVRVLFYREDNGRNDNPGTAMVRLFAYLNTDYEYGRDYISWLTYYGSNPDQTIDAFTKEMAMADFVALGESGIDDFVTEAVSKMAAL
jgi:hypothetical protein